VSALIKNESSVTIKDAKAVMDLEEPSLKRLNKVMVECNECGRCDGKKFLVNKDNPRIKGDLLPWAMPEKPIKRPVLRGSRRFPIVYTRLCLYNFNIPSSRSKATAIRSHSSKWRRLSH